MTEYFTLVGAVSRLLTFIFQISFSQEAIFDAQNMLGNEVVEVDDMNLDLDIEKPKTHVNTTYKRNRFDTTIKNIDDSLNDLENALADQVSLEILIEILDEGEHAAVRVGAGTTNLQMLGGFQLANLIIMELKNHMTC